MPGNHAHLTRWRRWNRAGLRPALLDVLAAGAKGTLRLLDATPIKVHQDAANPAGGQAAQTIGRTKGGLKTKLTVLADAHGQALQITMAPGQRADVKAAEAVWPLPDMRFVADNAYDSAPFRHALRAAGLTTTIPVTTCARRKSPAPFHRGHCRLRRRVENLFQRFKRWRAVGTRYDKLDLHCLAAIRLVATLDWLVYKV